MNQITYTVPNISCHHCVNTIKSEVSELSGVKSVEGDVTTKKIDIQYDAPATLEEIENLLAEINYPVAK